MSWLLVASVVLGGGCVSTIDTLFEVTGEATGPTLLVGPDRPVGVEVHVTSSDWHLPGFLTTTIAWSGPDPVPTVFDSSGDPTEPTTTEPGLAQWTIGLDDPGFDIGEERTFEVWWELDELAEVPVELSWDVLVGMTGIHHVEIEASYELTFLELTAGGAAR